MGSLGEFRSRIGIIATGVEVNATELQRKVAAVVDQVVTLATPVDTGQARSNWQVGLDRAPDSVRPTLGPGTEGAQAAIDEARAKIAGSHPGREIHITNNLPYIRRLNEGSSAQAPANFVEEGIARGAAAVPGVKLVRD